MVVVGLAADGAYSGVGCVPRHVSWCQLLVGNGAGVGNGLVGSECGHGL